MMAGVGSNKNLGAMSKISPSPLHSPGKFDRVSRADIRTAEGGQRPSRFNKLNLSAHNTGIRQKSACGETNISSDFCGPEDKDFDKMSQLEQNDSDDEEAIKALRRSVFRKGDQLNENAEPVE